MTETAANPPGTRCLGTASSAIDGQLNASLGKELADRLNLAAVTACLRILIERASRIERVGRVGVAGSGRDRRDRQSL